MRTSDRSGAFKRDAVHQIRVSAPILAMPLGLKSPGQPGSAEPVAPWVKAAMHTAHQVGLPVLVTWHIARNRAITRGQTAPTRIPVMGQSVALNRTAALAALQPFTLCWTRKWPVSDAGAPAGRGGRRRCPGGVASAAFLDAGHG